MIALGLVGVHVLRAQIALGVKGVGLVVLVLHQTAVIVFHVGGTVIPAAYADGGRTALEEAGVPHQQHDHKSSDHDPDDRI
jgi:hypothetical protein